MGAGTSWLTFGQATRMGSVSAETRTAHQATVPMRSAKPAHVAKSSAGTVPVRSPSRSFIRLERMTNAMPLVKAVVTGDVRDSDLALSPKSRQDQLLGGVVTRRS